MNEQRIVGAAIRILGLWRIFINGGNAFYYVAIKQLGLRNASNYPVGMDIQVFLFNLILGAAIVLAAPAIVQIIYGRAPAPQSRMPAD